MSLKIDKEIKLDSDPCVLAWDNKLYVGQEDGSIKCFDSNLNAGKAWAAHAVQIFALTAAGGQVYSSSNDDVVRIWSSDGEKLKELPTSGTDVEALFLHGNYLYVGDALGNLVVYENGSIKACYNLMEEIKNVLYKPPNLYTVRDLYVYVTEIKPDESKSRFTLRHTIEGRAPICFLGNNKLLSMARGGNNLQLHDIENAFKKQQEVKVSDMIVTSLSSSGEYAWTGGWDGTVRQWKLTGDQLQAAGELVLNTVVNALIAVENSVYAALTGGRLIRIVAD